MPLCKLHISQRLTFSNNNKTSLTRILMSRMDVQAILSVEVSVTIDAMLNGDFDEYGDVP